MADEETAAGVRARALALPEADEREHMGTAAFRVRGKIFAQLTHGESALLVKLSLTEQTDLVRSDPDRVWLPNHWSKFGWTYVRIAGTPRAQLYDLLEGSWRLVAPRSLAKRRMT